MAARQDVAPEVRGTFIHPFHKGESLAWRVNTTVHGASKQILQALSSWEGLTVSPHRFGGSEFCLGRREIGHIHGDSLGDIPFPKKIRDEIVAAGEAQPHHVLPETGWVSFYLRQDGDVERAIALLRRSYEIALKQRGK